MIYDSLFVESNMISKTELLKRPVDRMLNIF